eukprot:TRINITY_DN1002_c0_g1_i1.p1 TRINITY_DN1002_c0_g1~~TRINITY_DN1002_c0_g1_i1.p1  ORF type:complete len:314 (+),score=73.55 TRINITY_DN1002_c0_g1_i1:68-1009(+)
MSRFGFLSVAAAIMCSGVASAGRLPAKTLGMYCLIADDTVANYTGDADWQPKLYPYQQKGSNVIWMTFVNPEKLPALPPAMVNLAGCKGEAGCPGKDVPTIVSVGGEAYSTKPWSWLASNKSAEAMAEQIASKWPSSIDGIDLDIEGVAGNDATSTLLTFVQKLRQLKPSFIITQPVYGYPQINGENYMVNTAWTVDGKSHNTIDSIGIMVYSDSESLQYVKDYANATHQWQGFPIKVDVPTEAIVVGIQGSAADNAITSLAGSVKQQNLGGIMVWYASVFDSTHNKTAFSYGGDDSSVAKSAAWEKALQQMS